MKKRLTLIMMIISLITFPLMSFADAALDSEAVALNKLTILQGDGINFNLTGQLKRSEAITFIVRIMGKESFVKANADKYSKTTFSDVKSTDWFAAYVGYCQENKILNGFPDGGFHPNDSISEKAFLKLVLGALGYVDEKDFVWDTIYESAFNLGLVSDTKYKTQIEDNTKYLRSDVVTVLYGSLTNSLKGSKKTIIESLIEANIVDRATAVQLGFAKEIVLATIESVHPANDVTLNIKLSKSVQTLADKDITIYETGNKVNQLKASVTSQVYGTLIVNTTKQIPDKGYTIEISNKVEESKTSVVATSTFVGYKMLEVKSDFFKISKIVPVSKNRINVYFTQPITDDIAFPIYYNILKNGSTFVEGSRNTLDVKVLPEQNNVIGLYLKGATIADDVPYSLKISGDIISAFGVPLDDGLGESIAFANKTQDNDILKVDRVYTMDSKTLRLEFNKELNPVSAKQILNYQLTSSTGIANIINNVTMPTDGKGKALLLTISGNFDKTLNYQIAVSNVSDIFNLDTLSLENYTFVGKPATDLKDLKIVLATAINKSTVQVYFDKNIDASAATISSYYMVTGVTDPTFVAFPLKVYVDPLDSTLVKLYFAAGKEMISTSTYKLKVLKQMPDEQGNISSTDPITTFVGSSEAYVKPLISEARIIGKDTIKIKSSKELLLSGANVSLSNYTLELKEGKNTVTLKTPSSIIAYDETTLILHFDDLDVTKVYTFKFSTLTDYSGLNTRSSADGSTSILLKNGDTK
jgi:hypothetical protein